MTNASKTLPLCLAASVKAPFAHKMALSSIFLPNNAKTLSARSTSVPTVQPVEYSTVMLVRETFSLTKLQDRAFLTQHVLSVFALTALETDMPAKSVQVDWTLRTKPVSILFAKWTNVPIVTIQTNCVSNAPREIGLTRLRTYVLMQPVRSRLVKSVL